MSASSPAPRSTVEPLPLNDPSWLQRTLAGLIAGQNAILAQLANIQTTLAPLPQTMAQLAARVDNEQIELGNGSKARWAQLRRELAAALGGDAAAADAAMKDSLGSHLISGVQIAIGATPHFGPFATALTEMRLLDLGPADMLLLRLFYAEDFGVASSDSAVVANCKLKRWMQVQW